jgi:glycerol-3-phosphate dehydrogenase
LICFPSVKSGYSDGMDTPDLLVVGGGINGTAIARDAAGRGLKVLLVEQGDLAQATSSASTKLIHGGLRYLETYDLRLVRESLVERATMLRTAPHLVSPLRFVLPQGDGSRPWWMIRAGLWLYDLFGIGGGLPRSRAIRIADPELAAGPARGFAYWDAWVDDARLVVTNALDAADKGATVRTRARLLSARRERGRWLAEILDVTTGESETVSARVIVNAGGPWVEEVLRGLIPQDNAKRVRLVKGSHIVVPQLFAADHAWLLQQPDKRIVFAIPYEGKFTLIGTTDVAWDGAPGPPQIDATEVDYLCAAANACFGRQISSNDVQWAYSGLRALHDDGRASASEVTRDYVLELDDGDAPLLSVIGGKITTARALAEEAVDMLAKAGLGSGAAWTGKAFLPGGDIGTSEQALAAGRKRWPFLAESRLRRLLHAYGSRLALWLGDVRNERDLGEDFGGGLTRAEVDYLIDQEWARTPEDILWRRTKIGLHIDQKQTDRLAAYLVERA